MAEYLCIFRLKCPYKTRWSWQAATKSWGWVFFYCCCSVQFVFSLLPLLLSTAPPPSHQLCLSAGSAHALQLTHPLRTPTFHPNLLPTLGHSSAGMQLHSQGVKAFLGIRGPCSSSPAEPGRPTFPLSFCTLQFDIPCTPSSAVTACPARQTSIAHMG